MTPRAFTCTALLLTEVVVCVALPDLLYELHGQAHPVRLQTMACPPVHVKVLSHGAARVLRFLCAAAVADNPLHAPGPRWLLRAGGRRRHRRVHPAGGWAHQAKDWMRARLPWCQSASAGMWRQQSLRWHVAQQHSLWWHVAACGGNNACGGMWRQRSLAGRCLTAWTAAPQRSWCATRPPT